MSSHLHKLSLTHTLTHTNTDTHTHTQLNYEGGNVKAHVEKKNNQMWVQDLGFIYLHTYMYIHTHTHIQTHTHTHTHTHLNDEGGHVLPQIASQSFMLRRAVVEAGPQPISVPTWKLFLGVLARVHCALRLHESLDKKQKARILII